MKQNMKKQTLPRSAVLSRGLTGSCHSELVLWVQSQLASLLKAKLFLINSDAPRCSPPVLFSTELTW